MEPIMTNPSPIEVHVKLTRPWWWEAAIWVSLIPWRLRHLLTGWKPSDADADAFAERWGERWARHLYRHLQKVAGYRAEP